jgi:GPI ethanolamine phosphate transferase 1
VTSFYLLLSLLVRVLAMANYSHSSPYNVPKLLILGLIFHLIYIGSVFDCYFTSPVVKGMQSFNVGRAESKRLVLIIGNYSKNSYTRVEESRFISGDGLRADLLFNVNGFSFIDNAPAVVAPHLRSIAETRGAFGVSHTHVPTETRPGHVAIIGTWYSSSLSRPFPNFSSQVECMKTFRLLQRQEI